MLKIAILTYSTKPRGGVVHSLCLAENLAKRGHEVRIIALDKKEGSGFFRIPQVSHEIARFGSLPESFDDKIEAYIQTYTDYFVSGKAGGFDIYHAQDCISANALVNYRLSGADFPLVRTVHHLDDFTSPVLINCQNKSVFRPDAHIAVSEFWQKRLAAEYGVKARVIHNGLDTKRFSPAKKGENPKAKFGLENKLVFLTIGGIEPRKNTKKLLAAFAHVRKYFAESGKQAVLVIGGGQTLFDYQAYRQEFLQMAEGCNLKLGEDVINLGVLKEEDVPLLYQAADCFAFPSAQEGWGLVALEALLSGIPTVVSDIPVFHEFLTPGEDALFVDPDNGEQFAAAMIETIIDSNLRRRLISGGLMTASNFSWEDTARKHEQFYYEILEGAQAGQ
ncbi:MSMEG_0565 family glycosyltransferase [Desulfitobacterium chlororespirans]|uniref:Glycosyltransferase, MSMEG_0565 family n=1 Tax=Desulfitobacterium chlororespirans DSM 11544 TaxID=1121395 RepID=A0A1M7UVQ3_9FIRM|nr:MSMEG_0565 family glycosyltransferase [Desulfitobacterium chlororespirans]SHN87015.1 glycosyltransferase, MSMEG_0565 family [Desulfitobacterium chlororespirans DSM 11544]